MVVNTAELRYWTLVPYTASETNGIIAHYAIVNTEHGLSEKRRGTSGRMPLLSPTGPDRVWAVDFVTDCFEGGGRFRAFVVVDV